MTKVKFLMAIAGGIDAYKGDIKMVDDKEAKRLIKANICELCTDDSPKGKRPRVNTR